MKKIYYHPEMKVVELKSRSMLLVGSPNGLIEPIGEGTGGPSDNPDL